MGLRKLGDSAWLFEAGGSDADQKLALILRLRRLIEKDPHPAITDTVSSFDSIAVHFDPGDGDEVFDHLTSLRFEDVAPESETESRCITVPVVYGGDNGPDLDRLASAKSMKAADVVKRHSGREYTVAALGFSPGFPYLTGLPAELHHPRHDSPRKVAAGSVAIAGDQTGIYPFASQGGWHVIGRTNLDLFSPERAETSLFSPGDRIRFEAVDSLDFTPPPREPQAPTCAAFEILQPGALTTVQDLGRPGWQHLGVSPGGAADPIAARVANRLVGNPDDAALLECSMTGPILRFEQDARVAWVGWKSETSGRPVEIKAGGRLDLSGPLSYLRGYIAVAGGIDVTAVLGSRATDRRAAMGGFHGRSLMEGDRLAIGHLETRPTSGKWHVSWPKPSAYLIELRFLRGMQASWFDDESHQLFRQTFYEINPASDRMGCRLKGAALQLKSAREMVSQPVIAGSIQVPPDGQPIVLMNERQTIGGYPQIGHVISADLARLARSWPGTQIHFREVSLEEARDAWSELQRDLGVLNAGLQLMH